MNSYVSCLLHYQKYCFPSLLNVLIHRYLRETEENKGRGTFQIDECSFICRSIYIFPKKNSYVSMYIRTYTFIKIIIGLFLNKKLTTLLHQAFNMKNGTRNM